MVINIRLASIDAGLIDLFVAVIEAAHRRKPRQRLRACPCPGSSGRNAGSLICRQADPSRGPLSSLAKRSVLAGGSTLQAVDRHNFNPISRGKRLSQAIPCQKTDRFTAVMSLSVS
ncbi:hypothetical protein [Prochlorococcus marinus]|uniref:hypothetical protein n=1 Tax=Prochlorococcus sp. MIT 1327 TaxID=3082527 RepID=UPI00094108B4